MISDYPPCEVPKLELHDVGSAESSLHALPPHSKALLRSFHGASLGDAADCTHSIIDLFGTCPRLRGPVLLSPKSGIRPLVKLTRAYKHLSPCLDLQVVRLAHIANGSLLRLIFHFMPNLVDLTLYSCIVSTKANGTKAKPRRSDFMHLPKLKNITFYGLSQSQLEPRLVVSNLLSLRRLTLQVHQLAGIQECDGWPRSNSITHLSINKDGGNGHDHTSCYAHEKEGGCPCKHRIVALVQSLPHIKHLRYNDIREQYLAAVLDALHTPLYSLSGRTLNSWTSSEAVRATQFAALMEASHSALRHLRVVGCDSRHPLWRTKLENAARKRRVLVRRRTV